jgi:signal transduction histidine kinase
MLACGLELILVDELLAGSVAALVALYTLVAYAPRGLATLGFAVALAGTIPFALHFDDFSSDDKAVVLLVLAAHITLAALLGDRRRTQLAQRAKLAELAAADERARIARELHDVVAHSLSVVIAQADGARYAAASEPAAATQALETIGATARSALADVRLLLAQLRHSEGAGPQPTLADLEGLYADVRAAGLDLAVDVDPAPASEPGAGVQLAVFRILQEALTNALRHGDGTKVDVALAWHPDRVELEVRNGVGSSPRADGGHGLVGMRERAQLAGGALAAGVEGERFVVRARLPIGGTA